MEYYLHNHPLKFTKSSVGSTTFTCNDCNKAFGNSSSRWTCEACDYNLCGYCAPTQQFLKNCKNGHALNWSESAVGYPGSLFSCDHCRKTGSCTGGRWYCAKCSYDVCSDCRIKT